MDLVWAGLTSFTFGTENKYGFLALLHTSECKQYSV